MEGFTYNDFINNILNNRGRFNCGNVYYERHHIVPKCMGGSNDETNLIDLYANEHFTAHKLLAQENPENNALVYAWWCMANASNSNKRNCEITAEDYEYVRECYSAMRSVEMTGEKHPNFGKHHSEQTRKKMSDAALGEKNHNFGKRTPDDVREKISKSLSGDGCYWYGKHHSDESKKKMSDANIGKNHPQCRPIYCCELDEYFWGVKEAADKYNINGSSISRCCKGKLQSAGKHPVTKEKLHWVYIDEMNNSSVA